MKKNKNMDDMVYKALRHEILTKKLYPNTQLVETAIAEKLGTSRTPVRDAIKKLSYEGLVKIIPRRGAFIVCPTKEEFSQLFFCRLLLETKATELAAANITDGEIKLLEEHIKEEMICLRNKDIESYMVNNKNLHMVIVRASRNEYIIKYTEELISKSDIYLIFYDNFLLKKEEDINSFQEHRNLVESLKNRDPQKSAQAMEVHIKSIFENLDIDV